MRGFFVEARRKRRERLPLTPLETIGRRLDRRPSRVRRRPRRRPTRHAPQPTRVAGRPREPVPAPVDAPVDQRAARDRPAGRHPAAFELLARRLGSQHAAQHEVMECLGRDALGRRSKAAGRPTARPTSTACAGARRGREGDRPTNPPPAGPAGRAASTPLDQALRSRPRAVHHGRAAVRRRGPGRAPSRRAAVEREANAASAPILRACSSPWPLFGAVIGPVALAWGLQRASAHCRVAAAGARGGVHGAACPPPVRRVDRSPRLAWPCGCCSVPAPCCWSPTASGDGASTSRGPFGRGRRRRPPWGLDNALSRGLAERDPGQVVAAKATLGYMPRPQGYSVGRTMSGFDRTRRHHADSPSRNCSR